ncbi:uncharacterized protein EDB93DRAFT_940663 [Suillus bovinus]|uniref:uncharacterized protein n=1 Tax=Suillus bovinus TaxID=48563 RepID=UPI001B86B61C|nr:uncharacterized protein EDB93DRAFT_940663 [Suillus bovinus]KAG2131283.1 hypothetical protein EDB93DRAFT_940663 [Suillus bovinus]
MSVSASFLHMVYRGRSDLAFTCSRGRWRLVITSKDIFEHFRNALRLLHDHQKIMTSPTDDRLSDADIKGCKIAFSRSGSTADMATASSGFGIALAPTNYRTRLQGNKGGDMSIFSLLVFAQMLTEIIYKLPKCFHIRLVLRILATFCISLTYILYSNVTKNYA